MSSIIVLDSSDEDESPPKKNFKSASDNDGVSIFKSTPVPKNQNSKQRVIPRDITITPHLSPTAGGANGSNLPSLNSNSLAGSYQTLNSIINNERKTPTPPKGQMAGSLNTRKRKTPTPPQTMPRLTAKNYVMSSSSPAKAATTVAPLPPIMPMITGVHSMAAAGATPPLQLMATPPHSLGAFMGLNEQLMINPNLIPSSLPPNTTITAHSNPNHNNINNNFKIHLPFSKPSASTPSPAASPASSAPKTPSPQLAPSPQPNRADKNAKRIKPQTLLRSSDESWQKQMQMQNDKKSLRTPISLNNDVVIEMLPPSTESPKSVSTASSRHHTPMTSPTIPKSHKSPDVVVIGTSTNYTPISRKDCDTILDLTNSPDKVTATNATEIVDLVDTPDNNNQTKQINGDAKNIKADKKLEKPLPKPPLEPEYEELIEACREADPSKDMEKLIKSKLIKYYYEVHSDYVKSKSFRKNIRKVVDSIKAKPDLVYYNLKSIVEELKVRRKAIVVEEISEALDISGGRSVTEIKPAENAVKNTTSTNDCSVPAISISASATEISATATASTGNKRVDEQIRKLNKALYVLTKRIEVLEQSDVDWDDDDSSYLQVERFKKRACQIYEKICDLTGESKNAHRLVKKPIKFNETRIPQFNKTLQAFINRTKEFPDYFDVLRMLEHCNRTYSLGLVNFEIKNIAEDAFIRVGKLLQSRRKADLYEMVTHFAGDGKDPAKTDAVLAAKLNENLKNHKKINDILEKYARKQDMPDEEEEEKSENVEVNSEEETVKKEVVMVKAEMETVDTITAESVGKVDLKEDITNPSMIKTEEIQNEEQAAKKDKMGVDEEEDDEDDDDEEDEEDEENLDEQVETLANGDISDNESDNDVVVVLSGDNKNGCEPESVINDNLGIGKRSIDSVNTPKDDDIDINSQEIIIPEDTTNNCIVIESSTIKIESENDSLLVNNNNNLNVSTDITKTVENSKTTELFLSPPSPTIPLVSALPVRNGKLKELLTNDNTSSLHTATNPSILIPPTVTATTAMADLKIVHVSSLEPEATSAASNTDDGLTFISGKNIVDNISSANKSLEEIVISDEES